MKNNKASGPQCLTIELIKYSPYGNYTSTSRNINDCIKRRYDVYQRVETCMHYIDLQKKKRDGKNRIILVSTE